MLNPFKFRWIRNPDFTSIQKINYDTYWENRGFKINEYLKDREKCILKLISPGSRVLNLGCGNSRLALDLKKNNCDCAVADISGVVLKEFSHLGFQTISVDLTNVLSLRFPKNFDYIILSEVLEHLSNPEEVIQTLSSQTDYFIFTIPNSAFIWFRMSLLLKGRFFTQWVYHPSEHLRYWSHIDFLDWLKAMKLIFIEAHASNGIRFLKDVWLNLFGFQIVYLCQIPKTSSLRKEQ